ncbi:kinesin-like protein Klp61F isoform X2 [Anabrus simplex]|uniref:kinesin-like protein Klp61F isoform X2 n=1 Tax=Anabrus simplex TaxID=316456 RepID=UPI0035A35346
MDVSTGSKDKNQHIKVFVRVRPLSNNEKCKNVIDYPGPRELLVRERPFDKNSRKFIFDKVFGPSCQQVDVYRTVVSPLVSEVLAGYNCTVFAYGQTGTGKTFTMEGEKSNDPAMMWHEDPLMGIIPRALSHLFDELRILQAEYSVKVSFLELYNEELLDLLSPVDDSNRIKLYEDATKKGAVIVHGLQELTVRSKNEVYEIMERGSLKRQTAATMLNAHSSRSHTVFTITVHIKENSVEGDELIKLGKLNLVDLAGSENIGRSGATEKRAREAGNINQSLLTLGRVITSLVERAPHVPYRESKLTRLLQESLGGRTKTSIIATVSPHFSNMEETLNTLEYAHRAKNIQNKPEINQKMAKKALIKEYTEEIERLRKDLIASREQNGIYVAEENYYDMLRQIETQKNEMATLLSSVKTLRECLEEKEKLNADLSLSLADYNDRLVKAMQELDCTKGKLKETICDRNEKEYIIEHHLTTEQKLLEQAHNLLAVADKSTVDNENLHNSLNRRRMLENDNSANCRKFQNCAEQALTTLQSGVKKLQEDEEQFAETLQEKLGHRCEDVKKWSCVAEGKVTSIIQAQISLQQLLQEELAKLDPSVEVLGQSQAAVQELRDTRQKILKEASDYCQGQLMDLKLDVTKLRDENEALRKDLTEMMVTHKRTVAEQVEETNKTMEDLKESILQKLKYLRNSSEQERATLQSVKVAKRSFIENMQQTMQQFMNSLTTFSAGIDENCEEMGKMNSSRQEKLEELHQDLDNLQECEPTKILTSTDDTSVRMDERLKTFSRQVSGALSEIENNADRVLHNAIKVTSSESETWQEHSQSLNDDLAIVSSNLRTVQENHKGQSLNIIKELESSVAIHEELIRDPVHLFETVKHECSTDVETHLQGAQTIAYNLRNNIEQLNRDLNKFIEEDIQHYAPSGKTPERQEITYPRNFKPTSPHELIIQRYRARMEEEAGITTSIAIEEKENTGKDEISSAKKGRVTRKPRKILTSRNN